MTLPEVSETLVEPDPAESATSILELDELWSLDELWPFVLKRANKRWLWIALSRATRQVVAYVVGDRSRATCKRLWKQIPAAYRHAHCYSDFWEASQGVIPAKQDTAAGKETGFTAHVERWKLTLRQRLARCVRRTLSCSKSSQMDEACLRLFIHRYNNSHALTLLCATTVIRNSVARPWAVYLHETNPLKIDFTARPFSRVTSARQTAPAFAGG